MKTGISGRDRRKDAPVRVGGHLRAKVVAITIVLAAAGFLASCGSSSKPAGVKGGSEVAAQPVKSTGANPFMPKVGTDVAGVTPPAASPSSSSGPSTYDASLPGLYGGTRNYATCDAAKLVSFLQQNQQKAVAWASTLGIQTSQISDYVSGLTPVLLRTDTRVTNHGYVGGQADPIQAVLEAGTAVFVDKYGQPAIKCYCGNPLTPPVAYTAPTYTGTLWTGFSPTHITIINRSTTIIKIFTLYDPSTGTTFTRPAGTSGAQDGPYAKSTQTTTPGTTSTPQPASPSSPQPAPQPAPAPPQTNTAAAENPAASFSPNPGKQGDTFTLTATGFNPGAHLQVMLTRPDGVVESYAIDVGNGGTGSYVFTNTGSVITGTYNATVTNPATGASAQASLTVQPAM